MATAFLYVFCSTKQKGKSKCTAAVLRKLTSGAKEIKMDWNGKFFEEIFCWLFNCVAFPWYVSWQAIHPIQIKNWMDRWMDGFTCGYWCKHRSREWLYCLQQNSKFSISSWKISNNFTWIDQRMENLLGQGLFGQPAINYQLLFNLVLIHGSTRSQKTFASMLLAIFWVSQFTFLLVSTVNEKPHGRSRLQAKIHIFKPFQSRMAEPASPLGNNALLSTTTANPDNSTLRTCQVRSKIAWASIIFTILTSNLSHHQTRNSCQHFRSPSWVFSWKVPFCVWFEYSSVFESSPFQFSLNRKDLRRTSGWTGRVLLPSSSSIWPCSW